MSNDSSEQKNLPRVPWNPLLGVLYGLFVFYAAQIASALVVSIYPWMHHWTEAQSRAWLSGSINAQFVYFLIAESLTVAAIVYFLKRYKLGLDAIGLKKPKWSDPLYGISAVPLYLVSYFIVLALVIHFVPSLNIDQVQEIGFDGASGWFPLTLTFISLVILPPLTEEILVRGFLYSTLKKIMPTLGAVLITSLIFAAAHLPEGGASGPLYIAAIDTFILSLVLIYLREITGSLWAGITLHAIKNGYAFILLFVQHVR